MNCFKISSACAPRNANELSQRLDPGCQYFDPRSLYEEFKEPARELLVTKSALASGFLPERLALMIRALRF